MPSFMRPSVILLIMFILGINKSNSFIRSLNHRLSRTVLQHRNNDRYGSGVSGDSLGSYGNGNKDGRNKKYSFDSISSSSSTSSNSMSSRGGSGGNGGNGGKASAHSSSSSSSSSSSNSGSKSYKSKESRDREGGKDSYVKAMWGSKTASTSTTDDRSRKSERPYNNNNINNINNNKMDVLGDRHSNGNGNINGNNGNPTASGPGTRNRRKVRKVYSFADLSTQPDNFYRTLCYDHLSTNALTGIEAMPHFRFDKGDSYLTKWWYMCKKWGLLTGKYRELDEKLTADYVKEHGKMPENNQEIIEDVVTDNEDDRSVGSNQVLTEMHNSDIHDDQKEGEVEGVEGRGRQEIHNAYRYTRSGKKVRKNAIPAPLDKMRIWCDNVQPRVICVGDVHGCVDEVCDLLIKIQYRPGDIIIFLGDLVAKGPKSVEVIQLAMDLGALSVRGNHDHEVVRQGVTYRNKRGKYKSPQARENAIVNHEHLRIAMDLSLRELNWLAQLPYYICSVDLGTLFVHAGFQSNVQLNDQDPWVMMTMRSLLTDGRVSARCIYTQPWANHWNGPLTVLFGHDAARGLQHHDHAIGLDTGVVYGGELSALILPDKEIISVPAREVYANYVNSRSHKSYMMSKSKEDEEVEGGGAGGEGGGNIESMNAQEEGVSK